MIGFSLNSLLRRLESKTWLLSADLVSVTNPESWHLFFFLYLIIAVR